MTITLSSANDADVPFIAQTERLEGYGTVVGRWSETEHRRALLTGEYAYFIGRYNQEPVGFAILRGWKSAEQVTLLQRIAVLHPGRGVGGQLLRAVVDITFRETEVYRFWLGVFPDNVRARRAYEAAGFKAEGIARGNAFFAGVYRDELIMSMLRPEWELKSDV